MQRRGDVTWKTFLLLFFGFVAIYVGSCSSPPRLESIAVTPPNGDVSKGLTQQFKATGTYSNGSTRDLSQSVSWTSSDKNIVTIAAGGLATAVATGTATIQASQGAVTDSTKFTVLSAAVASIAVAPRKSRLCVNLSFFGHHDTSRRACAASCDRNVNG